MTSWRPDSGQGSFGSFFLLTTLVDSRDADLRQIAQDLGRDATVAGEELVISARSGLNTCVDRRTDPTHTCIEEVSDKIGGRLVPFQALETVQMQSKEPQEAWKDKQGALVRRQEADGDRRGTEFVFFRHFCLFGTSSKVSGSTS